MATIEARQPRVREVPARSAALLLVAGTVLYVVPSAIHGNPPIDSVEQTLQYVTERPGWRLIHLVNILALLLWMAAFSLVQPWFRGAAAHLGRVTAGVFTVTAAVFAVYFSLHAFGLPASANRLDDPGNGRDAVLEQTESVFVVLGSIAFTAQALIGLSILLTGLTLLAARQPTWLSWPGVLAGSGWLTGALAVKMSVVVPFTALTWLWTTTLAITLWRHPPQVHAPKPR